MGKTNNQEPEKNPSSTPIGRLSIREFIDINDKLLTAMGVMGALAALFTTVKNGQLLAFLAFAMLLVLDVELIRSFYSLRGVRGWSETLIIFETLLEFLIGGIALFIIQTYTLYFMEYLLGPIFGIAIAWYFLVRRKKKSDEISVKA
jgi:hypothetical protein